MTQLGLLCCHFAKCRYAEYRYADCRHAECHYVECCMLNVVMLNVVALLLAPPRRKHPAQTYAASVSKMVGPTVPTL